MPAADLSIVDEVELAINAGSAEKPLETIKRVPDLFLSSAGSFNGEQIELFDNVLERLIKTIEIRAIADVSSRIALAELSVNLLPLPKRRLLLSADLQGTTRSPSQGLCWRNLHA